MGVTVFKLKYEGPKTDVSFKVHYFSK